MLHVDADIVALLSADYFERRELTRGLGVEQTWTDYCTGLEASLLFNSYTYTVQPSPLLSKVDLASVFFNREKYAASGIRFGKCGTETAKRSTILAELKCMISGFVFDPIKPLRLLDNTMLLY